MSTGEAAGEAAGGRLLLYGRRRGRRLRSGRQLLVDETLPRLAVALPPAGPLDPRALFAPAPAEVWLEIGFGGGEHLVAQAEAHPSVGLIGCEPYLNGVAALLARLGARRLGNVRVLMDDARPLLAALADGSLARVFILFPDPWPKKRHHRRRIVGPATVAELARVMADGGELRLATDHGEYARWMLGRLLAEPAFEWLAERAADWRDRGADWPETRFEAKAKAAGSACYYFRFRRRCRGSR